MSEESAAIEKAAVAWFVLLRDEAAAPEQRARFSAWLAASPRHRQAWREVEALWGGLDGLGAEVAALEPRSARPAQAGPRAGRALAAAVALLLLLAGGGAFWALQPPGSLMALLADERSGTGERRSLVLPDRTRVELGAESSLSLAYDDSLRRVVLHGGEAYFSVRPDADWPFAVEAGDGRVTVVGTAFEVRRTDAAVEVAVAEGAVSVAPDAGPALRLSPGQGVRYDAAGAGRPYAVEPADVAAWREDRLVFEATPLVEVLDDLERYRGGPILVTDSALAALPVTGVFDTRRPEAALQTIARSLPVRLLRLTGLLVLVLPAG